MAYLMVVDDDADLTKAIAIVLRDAGHEVDVQLHTDGALAAMKERPPDLLVLDVMFPEDDSAGFKLAITMHRDHEELKHVPIIMLTGVNLQFPLGFSADDISEEWLPVTEFLQKPVDLDVLCNKISETLAGAATG